jgi:antitoxin MazE
MTETNIQQWGNSLAVRLPKQVAINLKLRPGSRVLLDAKAKSIVIKPWKKTKRKTLTQLLKGINEKNRHPEYDWGEAMGKEVW